MSHSHGVKWMPKWLIGIPYAGKLFLLILMSPRLAAVPEQDQTTKLSGPRTPHTRTRELIVA